MRRLLTFTFTFLTINMFTQTRIVCVDAMSKETIPNVLFFNNDNKIIGVADIEGSVFLTQMTFPINIKVNGYEEFQISEKLDTVFLNHKETILEEVAVNAERIYDQQFYKNLLKKSNQSTLTSTNMALKGEYFDVALFTDLNTGDSAFIMRRCELKIKKVLKSKEIIYNLFPSNGTVMYINGNVRKMDSTKVALAFTFLPRLENMLEMDMTKTKKFELDLDKKSSKRKNGLLMTEKKFIKRSAKYNSNLLTEWNEHWVSNCTLQKEKALDVCVKQKSTNVSFHSKDNYYLSELFVNSVIELKVGAENIRIISTRGFVEDFNSGVKESPSVQFKTIEEYFQTLK